MLLILTTFSRSRPRRQARPADVTLVVERASARGYVYTCK